MRPRRFVLAAALIGAAAGSAPAPAAAQYQILHYPQVDVAPDGAATVVWQTGTVIRARRRAANGTLGPTLQVSAAGTSNADPRVAVDGNGVATVMWRKVLSGASGVVQTRRVLTNNTQGAIIAVAPQSQPTDLDLAVSANGMATYAWRDLDATTGKSVVRVRQRLGVDPLRSLRTAAADAYNDSVLDVATDQNGNATIAWMEWDAWAHVLTTRRLSSGGTFNAPARLTVAGADAFRPQIAVAPSGRATFVWTRSDGSNQRVETRWRDPNGTVGATVLLSDAGQWASLPQVASDQDGDMTFAWQRYDGANYRAQTRTRFAAGTLSTVQTLTAAGAAVSHPKVDVSPIGDARFAWNLSSGTSDPAVQTRRRLASGALGPAFTPSTGGSKNIEQQVAVDPNGKGIVVWNRQGNIYDSTNPSRVQLSAIDAAGNVSPTQNLE